MVCGGCGVEKRREEEGDFVLDIFPWLFNITTSMIHVQLASWLHGRELLLQ